MKRLPPSDGSLFYEKNHSNQKSFLSLQQGTDIQEG